MSDILKSSSEQDALATLDYLEYKDASFGPPLLEVLEDKTFGVKVRAAAAGSLGRIYLATSDSIALTRLKKILYDQSEDSHLRAVCYFSMLLIKDLTPFPVEELHRWGELFDSFRFPEDVNWDFVADKKTAMQELGH